MAELANLNREVTVAIWRAERMEKGSVDEMEAYRVVSRIEEKIAKAMSNDTAEGAYARDGAVRAALRSQDFLRAESLALQYLVEDVVSERLKACLEKLLNDARATMQSNVPVEH